MNDELERLRAYVEWILSLEEGEERRTITLTRIIDRAKEVA